MSKMKRMSTELSTEDIHSNLKGAKLESQQETTGESSPLRSNETRDANKRSDPGSFSTEGVRSLDFGHRSRSSCQSEESLDLNKISSDAGSSPVIRRVSSFKLFQLEESDKKGSASPLGSEQDGIKNNVADLITYSRRPSVCRYKHTEEGPGEGPQVQLNFLAENIQNEKNWILLREELAIEKNKLERVQNELAAEKSRSIRLQRELAAQEERSVQQQNELTIEMESCEVFAESSRRLTHVNRGLRRKIHDLQAKLHEQIEIAGQKQKALKFCKICFERPRNALIVPCMHFLFCMTCLEQRKIKFCPTCMDTTKGVLECVVDW